MPDVLVADCWESGGPAWMFGWMLSAGFAGLAGVVGWKVALVAPSAPAHEPSWIRRALGVVYLIISLLLAARVLSTGEGRDQLLITGVFAVPVVVSFSWAVRAGGLGRSPVAGPRRSRAAYFAPVVVGGAALAAAVGLFVAQMLLGRPC